MINAIVVIHGTVVTTVSQRTLARIMIRVVDTDGSILARIELFRAELDFLITVRAYKNDPIIISIILQINGQ